MSGTALPHPAPASGGGIGRVTLTVAALAEEIGASVERAERLLEAASERVLDYAPEAPDALLNEAVIRFAGYLNGSHYGGIIEDEIGPKRVQYTTNHAAAFRNSGAAGLLTRYKRRRAGAIG